MQTVQQSTYAEYMKLHLHIMMTQMGTKSGIKKFEQKGNDAIIKELRQLHDKKAMVPKGKEDLTLEDRQKALWYLICIKEKRDGTVTARGCADGTTAAIHRQRGGELYNGVSGGNDDVMLH